MLFDQFIKSLSKSDIAWFVIPNAIVSGNLVAVTRPADAIMLLELRSVVITQNGYENEVESLVVPTHQISAWGPISTKP